MGQHALAHDPRDQSKGDPCGPLTYDPSTHSSVLQTRGGLPELCTCIVFDELWSPKRPFTSRSRELWASAPNDMQGRP